MCVRHLFAVLVVGLAAILGEASLAQDTKQVPTAGRTPVPLPAKGKGEQCVAPVEWMRRNHMTALEHQRDRTVREGIRTRQFSLKGCIECHAVPGANGRPVGVADARHFCRTCHDYAAVKLDCFECHASRPAEAAQRAGRIDVQKDVAELARYLEGLER